jgi:hypothetical protein
MISKKHSAALLILVFSSLFLSACASGSSGFPTGKFYVSGSERTEGFEFNQNGSFNFFSGDEIVMEGTYSVDGEVYSETSNTGSVDDPNCNVPSKYTWSYDGSTLRFSLIEDSCGPRRSTYTDFLYVK